MTRQTDMVRTFL